MFDAIKNIVQTLENKFSPETDTNMGSTRSLYERAGIRGISRSLQGTLR
jgi:hypothetical protein